MKQKININNFLKKNSSTILTVIGSIGVGATAIVSAKDTIKAMKRFEEEKPLTMKKKIKLAAPCYIPTIITGITTILCICCSNKINKNIQKSLASAYVLLDQSYKEYRNSVKETYGDDGDLNVIQNISKKKAEQSQIDNTSDGDAFFDFFSLQFFNSNLDAIRKAEEEANNILKAGGYISLKTVYSLIGEDIIGTDNLLGWSSGAGKVYGYDSIEIVTDEVVREDGSKYYILDFVTQPTNDYLDF